MAAGLTAGPPGAAGQEHRPKDLPEAQDNALLGAVVLTVALPGTGHRALGHRRWVSYLAADLLSWAWMTETRARAHAHRDGYRDLAWRVARGRPEPRSDGDWGYYERLLRFRSSGAFDREPHRPGIQPETDPSTYNGSIWALAGQIFFPGGVPPSDEGDPAWQRALEYYSRYGTPPHLLWDWGENAAARAAYARLVRESDDAFRQSVTIAGVLLANRVLGMADLLATARWGGAVDPPVQIRGDMDPATLQLRLHGRLRVPW